MKWNFCMRVCHYSATGEGNHLFIVIAPTEPAAERLFAKEFGDYFDMGAVNFTKKPSGQDLAYLKHVPPAVFRMASEIPGFVYHANWSYNLS
jgi:hypothetical protein